MESVQLLNPHSLATTPFSQFKLQPKQAQARGWGDLTDREVKNMKVLKVLGKGA